MNILITGSTDGIGKLVGIKLAEQGHEVYLHGRNREKLNKVVSEIKEETKNENIKGFVADFSDLDAVKQMTQEIKQDLSKLDVLINNAGVYNSSKSQNKDGLDMRFAVNYLAPFLLIHELIYLLKKAEKPRIINLSSAAQSPINYEVLTGHEERSEGETYAQSKLALTMWSFYLAKTEPSINVIAVNPGSLLNTKMVNDAFGKHWSSADKGANILYELSVSEDYQDVSGKYFDNDRGTFAEAHPDAYNETKINKLITTTAKILAD
ncbi:SDR family NAD(P)-dependent oxidoreductase [Pleurocapsa sp. PCC 7319]|uniref:SDR family NAD(P)-dependent oxidoreductase n=1 Tax=Pleurocapsa sp. PCC 7319 TaxID=118161 RepID=UPI00034A18EA|nr:SDR family NAD(P)-dependent oxidoreductase [Pleurocapsa sp. PCC 7319]